MSIHVCLCMGVGMYMRQREKGKGCVLQCVSHVLIHASLYVKVFAFGARSMDSDIKWVYSPTSAQHLMDEKKN